MTMPHLAAILSPQPQGPRFLACVTDDTTREALSRLVSDFRWPGPNIMAGGIETALRTLSDAAAPPSILLVDLSDSAEPLEAMDELAGLCPPTLKVLTVGTQNDVRLYRDLIGMGVLDYLVKPVPAELLRDALQRAARADELPRPSGGSAGAAATAKKARVIALLGARGGVGTTTVAIGAGWCVAHEQNLRVALLDLDMQFGNLALSLDLEPGRGLREALEHPERLDGLFVAGAMSGTDSRFRVLAAEDALEAEPHIEPESIDPLLAALNADFDCIIVDLPRRLDGVTRRSLTLADTVVLVTDMSLAGMRDTMRLVALLKSMKSDAAPLIVANKTGAGRGEIPRADFERGIGARLDEIIPFDARAAAAVAESGRPLPQVAKSSKAAAELTKLGRRLSGSTAEAAPSLLRRLWG